MVTSPPPLNIAPTRWMPGSRGFIGAAIIAAQLSVARPDSGTQRRTLGRWRGVARAFRPLVGCGIAVEDDG